MMSVAAPNAHSLRRTAMIQLDTGRIHFHAFCLRIHYSVMTLTSTMISMKYAKLFDVVDDFHYLADFVVHRFHNVWAEIRYYLLDRSYDLWWILV